LRLTYSENLKNIEQPFNPLCIETEPIIHLRLQKRLLSILFALRPRTKQAVELADQVFQSSLH